MRTILPAEFVGMAQTENGVLDIGGVKVLADWWTDGQIGVYVRRESGNLDVIEIHMAKHDGLTQEELEAQDDISWQCTDGCDYEDDI